jgi:hypothetical protein
MSDETTNYYVPKRLNNVGVLAVFDDEANQIVSALIKELNAKRQALVLFKASQHPKARCQTIQCKQLEKYLLRACLTSRHSAGAATTSLPSARYMTTIVLASAFTKSKTGLGVTSVMTVATA